MTDVTAPVLELRTDKPTVRIVEMAPARAQVILEHCNERNRVCESRRIDMYAQEMTAGRWMFTGEAIKISREGMMLDGQHRLWALLEANRTLPLLVITGAHIKARTVFIVQAWNAGGDAPPSFRWTSSFPGISGLGEDDGLLERAA
jgi:hypothetical protein